MIMVFDTETSGLPLDWKAPVTNTKNWPRLVQLAWIKFDEKGREKEKFDYIVKPKGFSIPQEAEKVHGISTEKAKKAGKDLLFVLDGFIESLETVNTIVAHNMNFDIKVLEAECIRKKLKRPFAGKTRICTMKESTDLCQLPGRYGYKWPTLEELYMELFNKKAKETHNAMKDTEICAKCFFQLKKIGEID